ncbi:uncharacterized protein LOC118757403 [Rhagoletis pomonella]|uniref:uncharacterized protein LOC118757403 n=1 Tax=Rhagoletis pomonella TaxID=28610 RepID=UPI00177CB785|nr:uncharacterized protein LOC118757403 [Rhagoletis pomonella]
MGKKRNAKQEEIMLSFMQQNEGIAKGYSKGDRVLIEAKWAELTSSLNAVGPPCKDLGGWKKSWVDWKATIKKKLASNRRENMATGGGPYSQQVISPTEEAVAVVCNLYRAVEGIRGANTFGHASVQSVVVGEEATDLAAENVGDESNTSFIEVIDDTIEATGPQSTSRQRRHSTDAFEVVCIEQNSILNRIANVLDEVLVQKKNEFKVMEEKEQERKRHYQRMEEIEQEKLETLKKFL